MRRRRPPAGRRAGELPGHGIATCSRRSRRAPTRWKRRSRPHCTFTKVQRQLVGAYFLHEYSFEASALFNPSIVPHPDQSGAPAGGLRFILSLRAVGEGHVSSLTFRTGTIAADGSMSLSIRRLGSRPVRRYRQSAFPAPIGDEVELAFKPDEDISERVIFPVTAVPVERHRGRPLRRIHRWRPEDLLRDLHRLQRHGDPVGVDRDQRLSVVPDVAAAAALPRATRAWRCSRARSTASTP